MWGLFFVSTFTSSNTLLNPNQGLPNIPRSKSLLTLRRLCLHTQFDSHGNIPLEDHTIRKLCYVEAYRKFVKDMSNAQAGLSIGF